jgi:xanthine dehydrogenase YagS FAD-binding subunit
MAVPLSAFDALVHVVGPDGRRTIPLVELHRLPGDAPQRDTVLAPGELITNVELPPLELASRSTYRKARDRASFSFALVSLAAAIDVSDGTIVEARLALGGIAHKPWRARAAEAALRGVPATEESFLRAAEAELEQAVPLRDNGYKVQLARNLIVRTLAELAEHR